jgi:hypothetical protein
LSRRFLAFIVPDQPYLAGYGDVRRIVLSGTLRKGLLGEEALPADAGNLHCRHAQSPTNPRRDEQRGGFAAGGPRGGGAAALSPRRRDAVSLGPLVGDPGVRT